MESPVIPPASPRTEKRFDDAGLSKRERDAARAVLSGMSAKAAGAALGISASAVANYRTRAYENLGVADARELLATLGEKDALDPDTTADALLGRGLSETQARVLALVAAADPRQRSPRSSPSRLGP